MVSLSNDVTEEKHIKMIKEAFDKMIPEEDKVKLSHIKKKEVDTLRRRIISTKKNMMHTVDTEPKYLNMSFIRFTSHDIGLLIKANLNHQR